MMMVAQQNRDFLKAAESGKDLPKYSWPNDAPNVEPLKDFEGEHMAELEASIQHHMALIKQGSSLAPRDAQKLRADLELAAQYSNDITRLDAFPKYVAICRAGEPAPLPEPEPEPEPPARKEINRPNRWAVSR